MPNRTKRRMFLFDSKEATGLAGAASPRTMEFALNGSLICVAICQ
jgi:hypothetical protein